jgi:multidrug efflux pump subunit AcrA (membrane-fusion protein)
VARPARAGGRDGRGLRRCLPRAHRGVRAHQPGAWRQLRDKNLVSQQDVDDRQIAFDNGQATVAAAEANVEALQASAAAAEANVAASEANVRRLVDLQSFQKVRAPFGGFITVRNIDQGALIAAGSGVNTMPMFRLAQIDSLRVFVNVPQTFVQTITPGLVAEISVRELPARPFRAAVVSTANSLNPRSRTLLTEVRLRNDGTTLRPGMYADVKFHLTRAEPPLVVPSSAIIVRAAGPQVATVGEDRRLRFHPVQLGRDFGAPSRSSAALIPASASWWRRRTTRATAPWSTPCRPRSRPRAGASPPRHSGAPRAVAALRAVCHDQRP